ncbi:MAG: hypothetical protein M3Q10_11650 [Chloroflexota bacterium]|nr:hypothetical protein [Chloroflexota bacterium]
MTTPEQMLDRPPEDGAHGPPSHHPRGSTRIGPGIGRVVVTLRTNRNYADRELWEREIETALQPLRRMGAVFDVAFAFPDDPQPGGRG